MDSPRVRFTVRRMMYAVAVVAVVVGGGLTVARSKQLRDEYRQKAEYHAEMMEHWDLSEESYFYDGRNVYHLSPDGRILRWYPLPNPPVGMVEIPKDGPWAEGTSGLPEDDRAEVTPRILADRARSDILVSYHTALSLRYERAARYPWLPMPPDPPEPE